MISFSEAKQLVIEQAKSFGKEKVLLDDAAGRVISEVVAADRDYPPFNRAAMDGYAIRFSDWEAGVRSYMIRETIFAGDHYSSEIVRGECYKIMTGASVPLTADTIIRKEDVVENSGSIECREESVNLFQNIACRAGDLKQGQLVCAGPVLCSPAIIGLLASIGKSDLIVEKLPHVSIITTGNEIVEIDAAVTAVQIRDSNSHVLKGLLKKWNIIPLSCVHVPDLLPEIELAVRQGLQSDIIIICGAVSAGDADHVPGVLSQLGAENIFHKVSIKPGKPLWFGKFEGGPTVFALPGNPLSCLVTFKIFIDLFLSYSFGLKEPSLLSLPLRGARLKKSQLDEFFPVSINGSPSHLEVIPFNGSGDITAAIDAAAIARHPSAIAELSEGTILDAYPLF